MIAAVKPDGIKKTIRDLKTSFQDLQFWSKRNLLALFV